MARDKKSGKTAAPDAKEHHEHYTEEDVDKPEANGEGAAKGGRTTAAKQKFQQLFNWYKTHKKIFIPASVALFLVVFFAVPFTRYSTLGLFLKQDFTVLVLDSQTNKPVSSATVQLDGKGGFTDNHGKLTLHVPVGEAKLVVNKNYYKDSKSEVVVPLRMSQTHTVKIEATGRAVPVTVLNTITGKPVENLAVSAENTEVRTGKDGKATLVLPPGKASAVGVVLGEGYNKVDITIKVTSQDDPANTFRVTPNGKIYFLSNQSGKIDVVKSDLDGKNRQTVLAGTGKETKGQTVLLATRDWKYLALLSRRDGGNYDKLFLINTADDSLTTMDEGEATFTLAGWEGRQFAYTVNRVKLADWQPKKQALKSYDADSKKLRTLDQTAAEGQQNDYKYETFGTVYAVAGRLVYTKYWYGNYFGYLPHDMSSKQATLNSVKPDGGDKQVVKAFDTPNDISLRPYEPAELYVKGASKFYEYQSGKLKELPNMDDQAFYDSEYATYLLSPSGKQTFWSQVRDGRANMLVGNPEGGDEKRVATLSTDYQVFGWFTDEYLLVAKKGSELFIVHAGGVEKEEQLFKITDYYKPFYSYPGYGGGYGGL